ncbi:hypothetical protein AMAG_00670 [Allomyces macrogynus ATCC 38327]|uniref:Metallo-beta-lactamase domain-containing protein n=1 Tax=Allomyces macrogynus (strain ATCC 38327) TaxID=578462 RepID=A0A0L0RXC2_ALLM3|nr:hypothetical protein AMAG_00670 [Allomyces macrogynus ATCC 38327]|eukprot:KNE54711.1 hypothetical protein AMAG_00670 [Allomyces macrogynus ATCC 38327]
MDVADTGDAPSPASLVGLEIRGSPARAVTGPAPAERTILRPKRVAKPPPPPSTPSRAAASKSAAQKTPPSRGKGTTRAQQPSLFQFFARAEPGPPLPPPVAAPVPVPAAAPGPGGDVDDPTQMQLPGTREFECPVCGKALWLPSELEFAVHVNECLDQPVAPSSPRPTDTPPTPAATTAARSAAPVVERVAADRDAIATETPSQPPSRASAPVSGANSTLSLPRNDSYPVLDPGFGFGPDGRDDSQPPCPDFPTDRDDSQPPWPDLPPDRDDSQSLPAPIFPPDTADSPAVATEPGEPMDGAPPPRDTSQSPAPTTARPRRPCPFYKKIPDTTFAVDAFSHGAIPGITAYFLTHFHSDHYGGLSGTFTHGPIYCSAATANLVRHTFKRVRRDLVRELPMNEPVVVDECRVTCLDANHCPGAVMFLFQTANGKAHLHVGDFRACREMVENPLLSSIVLDHVFLDTTYLDPTYVFPPQLAVVTTVAELARRLAKSAPLVVSKRVAKRNPPRLTLQPWPHPDEFLPSGLVVNSRHHLTPVFADRVARLLILVGSYTIGKEKVFLEICKTLRVRFYCDAKKWAILQCLNDPTLLQWYSPDPQRADVHVVSMGALMPPTKLTTYLDQYKDVFSHCLALRPTGWTFEQTPAPPPSPSAASNAAGSSSSSGGGGGQRTITAAFAAVRAAVSGAASGVLGTVTAVVSSSSSSSMPAPTPAPRAQPTAPRTFFLTDLVLDKIGARVAYAGVPYSEHSSFDELRRFILALAVRRVVPTVNVGDPAKRDAMNRHLDAWHRIKMARAAREGGGWARVPWDGE